MTATKLHSDASPSSSPIWINCPASVTKARGRVRKATVYTTEGSAAHRAAELMLNGKKVPKKLMIEGVTVTVTQEMLDAAKEYADYVKSLPGIPSIETRLRYSIGGEDITGTADAVVIDGAKAEIVDFKYGQGVGVSPDSPQLRIYALGALEEAGPFNSITEVALTIVQPRAGGIKTVNIPVTDLSNWEAGILIPAAARLAAGDTTETPGDHCRWCVRAGECVTLANLAMTNAKVAFGDLPPNPIDMSNQDLSEILTYGEMIVAWVNQVRAEISGRIDNGQDVPGWKLVPKRAMRKWEDPDGAVTDLLNRGFGTHDVMRIETIGNIEKMLKRRKMDPEKVIYPYTVKESSGTTLVSAKDGRPAVDTSSKNVFNDLDGPFEIGTIQ
jgi:hypothetical protein